MKIVYLVSKGSYSDYSVMGVYSTKEKAEEIIRYFSRPKVEEDGYYPYDDLRIEERFLDLTPEEGKRVSVFLRLSDGEVLRQDNFNMVNYPNIEDDIFTKGHVTYLYDPPPIDKRVDIIYYIADTLERAVKAGNEKRAQFLASGLTKEDWNKTL